MVSEGFYTQYILPQCSGVQQFNIAMPPHLKCILSGVSSVVHIPVLPGKYLGSPRVLKPNALLLSKVNVHKYNNITMPTHLKCILSGAVACYRRESLSHVAAASKRDACPRCTYVEFISLYICRIHIMLPRVFSKMPSYIYVKFISSYILYYPEYYILTCLTKHTDVLSLFKPTWQTKYYA